MEIIILSLKNLMSEAILIIISNTGFGTTVTLYII